MIAAALVLLAAAFLLYVPGLAARLRTAERRVVALEETFADHQRAVAYEANIRAKWHG